MQDKYHSGGLLTKIMYDGSVILATNRAEGRGPKHLGSFLRFCNCMSLFVNSF